MLTNDIISFEQLGPECLNMQTDLGLIMLTNQYYLLS